MKLDTINTITTGTNQNPMEEVFVFMLSSAKIKTGKFEFIKPYLGTTGVGMRAARRTTRILGSKFAKTT